ncbi:MAG: hypothetical protein ACRDXD_08285 [Acidimicrobiia bacterium]
MNRVLGIATMSGGAALVIHILSGVSLRMGLAVAAATVAAVGRSVWQRASSAQRGHLKLALEVGVISGLIATGVYDLTRTLLSQLDTSPYDPFEAVRMFGVVLAGPSASPALGYAVGTGFHLLNGVAFGTAFCLLFGRRGLVAGIGWGLFLELFQITLYPGWLDIRAYREFAQISALSHVAYGATLGLTSRSLLERWSQGGGMHA